MKILISGASGLVGSSLVPFLENLGHKVIKLVRNPKLVKTDEIFFDLSKEESHTDSLEGFDVVIHLAGESISGLWTEKKKKLIESSRVQTTTTLVKALSQLQSPPKLFICASAVGYYGNREDEILNETSTKGTGFLAEVCQKWEDAAMALDNSKTRVVHLRFGVILSDKGGVLKKMILPFKLCLGGIIGSGHQYMSWIALDDVLRIVEWILLREDLKGPINVVSPNPVTNEQFTSILGKILHRPTIMKIPATLVKVTLGQMAEELLLSSTRAFPEKLLESHYQFSFSSLEIALEHLLRRS